MMDQSKPILSALNKGTRPTLSFEFFPPKDSVGQGTLDKSFERLLEFSPDFVSVTYGAMGSNQATSLSVVEKFATVVPTIAHLTCIGSTKSGIEALLSRYEDAGVAGLLALRGDVPAGKEHLPLGEFEFAIDLVRLATELTDLEIGVSAFPEKHPESENLQQDLEVLKQKAAAGADFAMTQLFFDINSYCALVESAKAVGFTAPIVPGLMPISNVKQVLRMAEMSGAKVPFELLGDLESATTDDESRRIGMEFTVKFAKDLIAGGAPGLHLFTLNHSAAVTEVIEQLELT